jgi:DNA-binding NtrC family response regulator
MATVLVVDDDEDLLDAMEVLLGRKHKVRRASSVDEALASLAEGAIPDVLITDFDLDGQRGDVLLSWVAVNYPDVRRILHTGTPRARLDGAAALAHRLIDKSDDVATLNQALDDFFRHLPPAAKKAEAA